MSSSTHSPLGPGADPLLGCRLEGRYHVVRHLADGGMGSVYVAHDERLDRDVALKVLRPDLARDPAFVARFRREAQSAARLTNPHVVAVHDQGEDAGHVFLAMELVRGRTLRDLLRTPASYGERLETFDQLLTGLAAAHDEGLAHRDIKPENVLIDAGGHVKVADFGLARAITSSTADSDVLLGTASYLSPEQVQHGHVDARSDVYSCGLVLYEILTGRRAFDGEVPINVAYRHVTEAVPPVDGHTPDAPSADRLIARACAKSPNERPANARRLQEEFRDFRAALDPTTLAHPAPTAAVSAHHSQAPTESHTAHLPHGATRVLSPEASTAASGRRSWHLPALVAGGLFALLLAWLFLLGPFGLRSVPDVHGHTQGQAIEELRSAGFDVEVQQRNDDAVTSGRAIGTSPEGGSRRWPFGAVTLDVSTGPRIVTVPDVRGRSESAARRSLEESHLRVRRVVTVYDALPAGAAVGTTPAAGTSLRHDSEVTLRMSKGPAPVTVPDVRNSSEEDALQRLTAAGLKPSVTRTSHDDVPAGAVISTDPSAGSSLHTGDSITVVVSQGKEQVSVPNVTGMNAGDARATLEDAGFSVEGVSWLDVLFQRPVTSQTPGGGSESKAPKGSTISLGF